MIGMSHAPQEGQTPFFVAARACKLAAVKALLEKGANVAHLNKASGPRVRAHPCRFKDAAWRHQVHRVRPPVDDTTPVQASRNSQAELPSALSFAGSGHRRVQDSGGSRPGGRLSARGPRRGGRHFSRDTVPGGFLHPTRGACPLRTCCPLRLCHPPLCAPGFYCARTQGVIVNLSLRRSLCDCETERPPCPPVTFLPDAPSRLRTPHG